MSGLNASFRDPLGLAWRLMQSGNRAAYGSVLRLPLAWLARPLDRRFARAEQRRIEQASSSNLPIVLLVGAPRSGSTLLYQTLTACLEVSYFPNLVDLFPLSPITATAKLGAQAGPQNFHNFYGQTRGLSGPNDGFSIWDRWLGEDRYGAKSAVTESQSAEMQRFFNAWLGEFNKPILNKNNRNTDCVMMLAEALPNTHFVHIHRSPYFTIQSLIASRDFVQGDKHLAWGVASREQNKGAFGYVDDVCDQVIDVHEQMEQAREQLGSERFLDVSYETLCADPASIVRSVAAAIPGVGTNELAIEKLKKFNPSSGSSLKPGERSRVQDRLASWRERRGFLLDTTEC